MNTIQDVVDELTSTARRFRNDGSALGYFPGLYRIMTLIVQMAIENGEFDDGDRMERFDILFAERYFDALEAWEAGEPGRKSCPKSWVKAFRQAERFPTMHAVIHLVLGVNAHVNLDLAVSAADAAPGEAIHDLRHDYHTLNDKFEEAIALSKAALEAHSRRVQWGNLLTGTYDDSLLNFSIVEARGEAWEAALLLAEARGRDDARTRDMLIANLDRSTAKIARSVCLTAALKAYPEEGLKRIWDWVEGLVRSSASEDTERREDRVEDQDEVRRTIDELLGQGDKVREGSRYA